MKWAVQPQDRNDGSKDFDIKGPDVVDFDFAAVVVIIIVVVRALDNGLNYCWGCHILHTGVLRSAPVDRSPLSVCGGARPRHLHIDAERFAGGLSSRCGRFEVGLDLLRLGCAN